jgi:SAM-dependent methyltransferase
MPIYHQYAAIYDLIGQDAFGRLLAERSLAELPAVPGHVLDLACGSGAAALVFAAAGSRVTGVDRSDQMLNLARHKAATVGLSLNFVQSDLRHLAALIGSPELPPARFDLATCFFDSLNYLTADGDLERVFEAVAALLCPGGRLRFDINTEAEFRTWDMIDELVWEDAERIVYNRLSYNPQQGLATGRVVWFQQNGKRWQRYEETHYERAWSDSEIAAAAAATGFSLIARRSPDGSPAAEHTPRILYEYQRSSR